MHQEQRSSLFKVLLIHSLNELKHFQNVTNCCWLVPSIGYSVGKCQTLSIEVLRVFHTTLQGHFFFFFFFSFLLFFCPVSGEQQQIVVPSVKRKEKNFFFLVKFHLPLPTLKMFWKFQKLEKCRGDLHEVLMAMPKHRTTAGVRLEVTSGGSVVQPLCSRRPTQRQIPSTRSMWLLDTSKDHKIHELFGKPVLLLRHPHRMNMFSAVQREPSPFKFVLVVLLSMGTTEKSLDQPLNTFLSGIYFW